MPKMKTNKSVAKRFHVTKGGKGKILVGQIGVRHGKTLLRRKVIRRKTSMVEVPKGFVKHIRKFMPYGGKK